MKINRDLVLILINIGLVVIVFFLLRGGGNDKEIVKVYEHLGDSTTYFKNKYNELVAENSVLTTTNTKDFLAIQSKDSLVILLQARVKQYKDKLKDDGSVVNFGTTTSIDKTTATTVIDSFPVNDSSKCNPQYKSAFRDKWIQYEIKSNKDSTKLKLMTEDNYSVVIGEQRPKWNKKKETFVDVIPSSPYARAKDVKAYKVDDKRKPPRLSLGVQAGYGFTLKGVSPYVGLGLSFNILNIR